MTTAIDTEPISRQLSDSRLLELAAFLDTIPRNRFAYETWVGDTWKGAPDFSCGTTACALGWATAMPSFRALGLKMAESGHPEDTETLEIGSNAACRIFGITYGDADFLFMPGTAHYQFNWDAPPSGAWPTTVAKHIRRFVRARNTRFPVPA